MDRTCQTKGKPPDERPPPPQFTLWADPGPKKVPRLQRVFGKKPVGHPQQGNRTLGAIRSQIRRVYLWESQSYFCLPCPPEIGPTDRLESRASKARALAPQRANPSSSLPLMGRPTNSETGRYSPSFSNTEAWSQREQGSGNAGVPNATAAPKNSPAWADSPGCGGRIYSHESAGKSRSSPANQRSNSVSCNPPLAKVTSRVFEAFRAANRRE